MKTTLRLRPALALRPAPRLSATALLAALSLGLGTAAPAARAQTTTWAQSYGVGSYTNDGQPVSNPSDYSRGADLPNAIAAMPDGGVVVGGQLELNKYYTNNASGGQTGGALVRYDRSGNIVWQTLLRQDNDSGGHIAGSTVSYVRTDAAGNIFACGVKRNGGSGDYEPVFVAKFAADGTLIWQTGAVTAEYVVDYDGNGNPIKAPGAVNPPTAMELTDDGGVILGASVYIGEIKGGVKYGPIIIKINADGSLGFHRIYENNNQYSAVRGVCPAVGGQGYAVLLSPDYGSSAPSVATIFLTDAAGNPTTQRTLNNPGGSGYGIIPQLITRDTEGGYFEMNETSQYHSEVRKLKADLTTAWAKQLNFAPPQDGLRLGPTLVPLAGGGCLIGGKSSVSVINGTGSSVDDALLLSLDGTGAITSAHLLGGTANSGVSAPSIGDEDRPVSACLTTDGGLAFTVTTFSYATGSPNKADWWVVKADANGKVPGFPDNMADIPLSRLTSTDSTEQASTVTNAYGPAPATEVPPFVVSSEPAFILENLASETGINKPTVKFQAAPAVSTGHLPFFSGEAALSGGAYYLQFPGGNPFGYYSYLSDAHYIYHFDLGYEYVFDAADSRNGVYLYDFASNGFFYTSPSFPFPYLYDFSLKTTVYYYPDPKNPGRYNTDGIRYFYRFDTGAIFSK